MSPTTFPRWTHLLAILLIVNVVGFLLAALLTPLVGGQENLMPYFPVLQGVVLGLALLYAYRKAGRPRLLPASEQPLGATTVVLAVVGSLFISIGGGALVQLLPGIDAFEELMKQVSTPTIGAAVAVVLIAPIMEEIICRGILLRRYLERTTPVRAILYSGLFFGILHMNPYQFVAASLMGFALGYVYYRTKSVYLVIGIHLANNLLAYLGSVYDIEDPAFLAEYAVAGPLLAAAVFGTLGVLTLRYFGSRLPAPPARPVATAEPKVTDQPIPADALA